MSNILILIASLCAHPVICSMEAMRDHVIVTVKLNSGVVPPSEKSCYRVTAGIYDGRAVKINCDEDITLRSDKNVCLQEDSSRKSSQVKK